MPKDVIDGTENL